MLVAGLLSSDQLAAIFLNTEELVRASAFFADKLRHAIDDAIGAGDRDLASVAVGGAFLEAMSMLRAFESYCTRQVSTYVCTPGTQAVSRSSESVNGIPPVFTILCHGQKPNDT